jgi:ATP-dependent DNA helicase RecG
MRPNLLNSLFAGVSVLEGVGPRNGPLLARLTGRNDGGQEPRPEARVLDLLWHLPSGLIDRRARPKLADTISGALCTVTVKVEKHSAPPQASKAPYRVLCSDDSGEIELIFFHADRGFLQRMLPIGEMRVLSGRVERYGAKLQMPHPDYMLPEAEIASLPLLEPVYPLAQGVTQKLLRKLIGQALDRMPELSEWLDERLIKARQWPDFGTALRILHQPVTEADLALQGAARARLAFDELFSGQLALGLMRQRFRQVGGRSIVAAGAMAQKIRGAIPFALTASQETALAEIANDMAAPKRMLRLLQGDVGSGKTIVALLAMARAVEAGAQAAIMAPTEILARQHHETMAPLAEAAGFRVGVLTGREQGKARALMLTALKDRVIQVLVGTHAIFQGDVEFADLALAVIDEQHRFGVHQRLALQAKGRDGASDILVMTATPIPRTLLMTHFGDMDVSRLTEKPAGRKPILTRAAPLDRLHDVVGAVSRARAAGAQVYWVCPLVETSAALDVSAAEERAAHLQKHFGSGVGMIHGRMKGAQKDAVMKAFSAGELNVLVATTVIEVGVNVPNATIMVIEHAERLGLAQLHQLRGRVGRGDRQSSCILLYQGPLSETGRARLEIMRETEDGFVIAEEDLRLRGGGEILGVRQSGDAAMRIARLPDDADLLAAARDEAKLLMSQNAELKGARGDAVRLGLYLFERDEAIRLMRAG